MTDSDPPTCPMCDVEAVESPVGWVCPDCDRWIGVLDSRGNGGDG